MLLRLECFIQLGDEPITLTHAPLKLPFVLNFKHSLIRQKQHYLRNVIHRKPQKVKIKNYIIFTQKFFHTTFLFAKICCVVNSFFFFLSRAGNFLERPESGHAALAARLQGQRLAPVVGPAVAAPAAAPDHPVLKAVIGPGTKSVGKREAEGHSTIKGCTEKKRSFRLFLWIFWIRPGKLS